MKTKCLVCGKEFVTYDCLVRVGRGKFCSRDCGYKGGNRKANSGSFKKGEHRSLKTEFKKGQNCREQNLNWKGGTHRLKIGYIMENCPNHPRAYRNEVYQHILVAEKKLGRYLEPNERVHHINGIKDDNRPENIIVFKTHKEHMQYHLSGRKREGQRGKWL